MEHRWGQRKTAHQPVRLLTVGGIVAHGYIVNVSISGSFVKTPLPARVLSTIQIAFVGENRRARVFRAVPAQVVRKTAEGLGLEWCEQMPDIVSALATAHSYDIADVVGDS
jgi:hypothetical protein